MRYVLRGTSENRGISNLNIASTERASNEKSATRARDARNSGSSRKRAEMFLWWIYGDSLAEISLSLFTWIRLWKICTRAPCVRSPSPFFRDLSSSFLPPFACLGRNFSSPLETIARVQARERSGSPRRAQFREIKIKSPIDPHRCYVSGIRTVLYSSLVHRKCPLLSRAHFSHIFEISEILNVLALLYWKIQIWFLLNLVGRV